MINAKHATQNTPLVMCPPMSYLAELKLWESGAQLFKGAIQELVTQCHQSNIKPLTSELERKGLANAFITSVA